jgi:CDP-6-deoxy-D-xylo-4-hexulose-3-dehydrase
VRPGRGQHLRASLRLDARHNQIIIYKYFNIIYNFKADDMQAAVGVAQLGKLAGFVEARRRNFDRLREGLANLESTLILPRATPGSEPCWFGFSISVRPDAPYTRRVVVRSLDARKVAIRQVFAGNLVRQPAYRDTTYRQVGDLAVSDFVMNQAFWLGVYSGLSPAMIDAMVDAFHDAHRELSDRARRRSSAIPAPHFVNNRATADRRD